VDVTNHLIQRLTERVSRQQLHDVPALLQALHDELLAILAPCQQPWQPSESRPYVILTVGVNGVGKTTTIGKLAQKTAKRRAFGAAGGRRHLPRRRG
jgi:fused signal recognition particle receptor